MIISFGLTTTELLAGKKTVTRRAWSIRQREIIQRMYDRGKRIHDAYDKSPRCGGHKIGSVTLTARPYLERLVDMPEEDLAAEGGMCKTLDEYYSLIGKVKDDIVTVIRFEFNKDTHT